ncbi:hypothetical protein HII31_07713 [Pseudocercospora fuligena]|uniref:Uncharacterized protein n=1 Tax=Pseudocercospora fuligena TaxID=685502 RepID=A0A8H6RFF1_9PEZI|nr:hypothetical protein HII31_07713 [Pseudocercospora fuligena]
MTGTRRIAATAMAVSALVIPLCYVAQSMQIGTLASATELNDTLVANAGFSLDDDKGPHWNAKNGVDCRFDSLETGICRDKKDSTTPFCYANETLVGWQNCLAPGGDLETYGLPICCTTYSTPRSCVWRGGETNSPKGHPVCAGQCHEGEVIVGWPSARGGTSESEPLTSPINECTKGQKLFCCLSRHWDDLNHVCKFGPCGGGCENGYERVTIGSDPNTCPDTQYNQQDYCCPSPKKFYKCRWAGSGQCEDNACVPGEVTITTHPFGDNSSPCTNGRLKSLCCQVSDETAFIPVDTQDLFPDPPPEEDYVNFEYQWLHGIPDSLSPMGNPFGWIFVQGPRGVVTSGKVKRDGSASDLSFLDCHGATGEHRQSIRFVCTSDSIHTDCNDMMEDGLPGTVIEMPERCTVGKYVVAHEVKISENQTLPDHLDHITNKTVLELTYDFDFGKVKRDSGDIWFRLDWSNVAGYWEDVVAEPVYKRRDLEPRFWSPDDADWEVKLRNFQDRADQDEGSVISQDFETILLSELTQCDEGQVASAEISVAGRVTGTIKAAVTMFGVIGPVPRIDHASVFIQGKIDGSMTTNVSMLGHLTSPQIVADLWPGGQALDWFYHPGLIGIDPEIRAQVALQVDADMEASFTTGARAFTSETHDLVGAWPHRLEVPSAQVSFDAPPTPFGGFIKDPNTPSNIDIDLRSMIGLHIWYAPYDPARENQKRQNYPGYWLSNDSYIMMDAIASSRIRADPAPVDNSVGATFNVSTLHDIAKLGIEYMDGMPEDSMDSHKHQMGSPEYGRTYASGFAPDYHPGGPEKQRPLIEVSDALLADAADMVCGTKKGKCKHGMYTCEIELCDEGDCNDDEDVLTGGMQKRTESSEQDILGTSRAYNVRFVNPSRSMRIYSTAYPSQGELFPAGTDLIFDYVNPTDCSVVSVTGYTERQGWSRYVTEHILELQTIARFLESAQSGILPSGKLYQTIGEQGISQDFFLKYWNSQSLPEDVVGIPGSSGTFYSRVPNERVFEILGSNQNRQHFVLARDEVNSFKGRLWNLMSPRDDYKMVRAIDAWLWHCDNPSKFLKPLKAARAVFSYAQHNDPVHDRLIEQVRLVKEQLQIIEGHLPEGSGLASAWEEYMDDFVAWMAKHAADWMEFHIKAVYDVVEYYFEHMNERPNNWRDVEDTLIVLEAAIATLFLRL